MIDSFFEELNSEIKKGVSERGHPFRFITMATVGIETLARLRTVVLREVSEDLILTIYTDSRTQKIKHLAVNNQISFLLYHPEKLLQLRIEGTAEIVKDNKRVLETWNNIQLNSRKDYITHSSPGSAISNPDFVEYLEDKNYFTLIDIVPTTIEYLRLQHPKNIRALFTENNGDWNGQFLVP